MRTQVIAFWNYIICQPWKKSVSGPCLSRPKTFFFVQMVAPTSISPQSAVSKNLQDVISSPRFRLGFFMRWYSLTHHLNQYVRFRNWRAAFVVSAIWLVEDKFQTEDEGVNDSSWLILRRQPHSLLAEAGLLAKGCGPVLLSVWLIFFLQITCC